MNPRVLPEELRTAIIHSLTTELWCDATDEEIAAHHRCSPAVVRAVRLEHRRTLATADVVERLVRLRETIGWAGTDAELLAHAIEFYRLAALRYERERDRQPEMASTRRRAA